MKIDSKETSSPLLHSTYMITKLYIIYTYNYNIKLQCLEYFITLKLPCGRSYTLFLCFISKCSLLTLTIDSYLILVSLQIPANKIKRIDCSRIFLTKAKPFLNQRFKINIFERFYFCDT